jgi:predicted CoA-binding protein
VIKDCAAQGIQRVWLQQGAQSDEALRLCAEHGIHVVSGECILMYAGKGGFHNFHRFFREAFGKRLA